MRLPIVLAFGNVLQRPSRTFRFHFQLFQKKLIKLHLAPETVDSRLGCQNKRLSMKLRCNNRCTACAGPARPAGSLGPVVTAQIFVAMQVPGYLRAEGGTINEVPFCSTPCTCFAGHSACFRAASGRAP